MSEKSELKLCRHCGAEPVPVHVNYMGHPAQYGWMCPKCRGVCGMSGSPFIAEDMWNRGNERRPAAAENNVRSCPQCGNSEIGSSDNYCGICGNKIREEE